MTTLLASSRVAIVRAVTLGFVLVTLLSCANSSQPHVLPGGHSANQGFIAQYDEARIRAIQEVPVAILAVGGELVVVRQGQIVERVNAIPPTYTALKEVSHVLLALWIAAWNTSSETAAKQTALYAPHLAAVEKGLADSVIPASDRPRQRRLLAAAQELIREAALGQGISKLTLTQWARRVAPDILENVTEAARAQLELINAEMTRILMTMKPDEKSTFFVVVGSVHQARTKNIQMQYFQALLGTEALENDRRVIYGESIRDARGALDLLGTHILDRAIAVEFFANPIRMQRDLLGDAAESILPTLTLPNVSQ